jgi:hypothetical protein
MKLMVLLINKEWLGDVNSMSNKHQIKNIFLIHNLINGIKQKGFASRATHIYWRDIDSTIRYSKKFKQYTHLFK